jgi:hypothetical protein
MAENVNRALGATADMRQLSLMPRCGFLPHSLPLTPSHQLIGAPLNPRLPEQVMRMLMVYRLGIPNHHLGVRKTYVVLVHHILSKLLMMVHNLQLIMNGVNKHLISKMHHIFSQLKPLRNHLQVEIVEGLAHALPE